MKAMRRSRMAATAPGERLPTSLRSERRALTAHPRRARNGIPRPTADPLAPRCTRPRCATPPLRRRSASAGSRSSRSTAAAIAPGSAGGTSSAVSSSSTIWGTPPTRVLTTGTPLARASSTEFGMLSARLGFSDDAALAQVPGHRVALQTAGEVHLLGNPQFGCEAPQCTLLGAGASHDEARVAVLRKHPRECTQRRGVVVDRLQVARDDQLHVSSTRLCGMKPRQVDDVRNHVGRHLMAGEDLLQEARRHDQPRRAPHRRTHQPRRSLQERRSLAAAVVDDHGHPPQRRDPDGRRCEEMPGPAGVGHHVHHVAAPDGTPQREPRKGSSRNRARTPCKRAIQAGRYGGLVGTSSTSARSPRKQLDELPRLHRHAASRRRQRADEPDAHACQCRHAASARSTRAS